MRRRGAQDTGSEPQLFLSEASVVRTTTSRCLSNRPSMFAPGPGPGPGPGPDLRGLCGRVRMTHSNPPHDDRRRRGEKGGWHGRSVQIRLEVREELLHCMVVAL